MTVHPTLINRRKQNSNRVHAMRRLRGQDVCPIIELSKAPMKTRFGMKSRPEFRIVDWCTFGGGGKAAIEDKAAGMHEVEQPSLKEELNDDVPWLG